MNYNPKEHHRRSTRLKEYDYSNPNWYYVTICTFDRKHLFGEVKNSKMISNEYGKVVDEEWLKTKELRALLKTKFRGYNI
ncbi:MAG: hypothetical protein A2315_12800 [Ignavibacteria bacterium RIFOXYB2_FULL_35_12]|nr:MAG: hypothetical protein A2058_05710 [Ignavibacteria bacterium GWA2_36_19]OGU57429.1 MAG: hypothetical protein A2X60_16725 [Ignavibacteria bacterium GWF2_35_20]OGU83569.1 MAG: hypothetical protein A2254_03465 [Ignavibacteria bacterium RIFOXYA2_FULL_35_9]OGU88366.1 MAG: hypothetical protein A2492_08760 [Ignavibacteria bacterium RIFOXYC12_FULL_35_11]OGU91563.1 MAG: hypothetical protein A3K31_02610 [Ignavibacteria bacterium RIFOXYA12_FULL_35_25]OGU97893.1 MAG: hypothetical protein A2347_16665